MTPLLHPVVGVVLVPLRVIGNCCGPAARLTSRITINGRYGTVIPRLQHSRPEKAPVFRFRSETCDQVKILIRGHTKLGLRLQIASSYR